MMRSVYTKTLYDKRWFIVGWLVGFFGLTALIVTVYPALHQDNTMAQLAKSMPPALRGFVGDLSSLNRFSTYLGAQLFDIRMQILGGVMVIILALGLSVAEEEKGELRTILALPVSRVSLLVQKWLAMLTIIAATLVGTVVGILSLQYTVGESIDLGELARLITMSWLLMVALGSIVFAMAMASGVRGLAMIVGILVVAGGFVITTFSTGVEWIRSYETWSLFYYFPAVDIVRSGIALSAFAVLASVTLISLTAALVGFRRRDIH